MPQRQLLEVPLKFVKEHADIMAKVTYTLPNRVPSKQGYHDLQSFNKNRIIDALLRWKSGNPYVYNEGRPIKHVPVK